MTDTVQELINILLDETIDDASRDDAATDLGFIPDDERVEAALLTIATDQAIDDMIRGSCGESLAQIWLTTLNIDCSKVNRLDGIAFEEAMSWIEIENPLLHKKIKDHCFD